MPMNETARDYVKQWFSPGVILGVVGWIFLLGVGSNRLAGLESKVGELQIAIQSSTSANQNSTVELVRYQERVASLTSRLEQVESFKSMQEQVNVRVFSALSKLGG